VDISVTNVLYFLYIQELSHRKEADSIVRLFTVMTLHAIIQ